MKRSGPPERKTPMTLRAPMAGGSSPSQRPRRLPDVEPDQPAELVVPPRLVRVLPTVRTTPFCPVPARVQHDGIGERATKRIVRVRSGGVCELAVAEVCEGRAANLSHRVAEGQGGPWCPSNGLDSCGSGTTGCHGWCHRNPLEAERRGWMLGSRVDPREAPARHARWGWVLLLTSGDFVSADPPVFSIVDQV